MNMPTKNVSNTIADETEIVLRNVNLALKCLKLYPANHAATAEAIDNLWRLLTNYFRKHAVLDFSVGRDGLFINNRFIGPGSAAIQSLASQLYRLQLEQIVIDKDLDRQQLTDLLMIICMSPEDVRLAGGVKELLWQKAASTITVTPASFDPGNQASLEKPSVETDKKFKIESASKALLSGAAMTDTEHQSIKTQLNRSPKQLARFINNLCRDDKTPDQANVLRRVILRIDKLIGRELPDHQLFLYRNLVEALFLIEPALRDEIASTLITAGGQKQPNPTSLNLIEQLTGAELAELFNIAVNTKNIPRKTYLEFLENFPLKAEQFRALAPLVADRLALDESTVKRLNRKHTAQAGILSKKRSPAEDDRAAKIAAVAADLGEQDTARLQQEISALSESAVEFSVIADLTEILTVADDLAHFTHTVHALRRIFENSFEHARLEVANYVLSVLIAQLETRNDNPDAHSIVKEALRDAGQSQRLERLLYYLENKSGVTFEQGVNYLNLLGGTGVLSLLNRLATEERQSRRRLICRLLSARGKTDISVLGSKVLDNRWYLVRNVVLILGQIGSLNSIAYLKQTLNHQDPRVRLETARALGKIAGTAIVLKDMLTDKDLGVSIEAIRSIATTKSPEAADILANLIKEHNWPKRHTDFKVETVKALGALKVHSAAPYLLDIINTRTMFFKGRQDTLRQAAESALYRIKGT